MSDLIVFEQPIHEHIRIYLRLEYLFQQAIYHLHGNSNWDSYACLTTMIEILNIFDNLDIKNKLIKELNRYLNLLSRFEKNEYVDNQKLTTLLIEFENIIDSLHSTEGRLGQKLRDNEFINNFRQYYLLPKGFCGFDAPAITLWLQQSLTERKSHLMDWFKTLENTFLAINLLLKLLRQSSESISCIAQNGFYQEMLNSQQPCQLLRVTISKKLNVYPEISVGRHGLCIRFFLLAINIRGTQIQQDIPFNLTTCNY